MKYYIWFPHSQVPGDTKDVKVGTLIALMVGEGEDWKDVAVPGSAPSAPSSAPAQAVPPSGGSGKLMKQY